MKKVGFLLAGVLALGLVSCGDGIEIAIDIDESFDKEVMVPAMVDSSIVISDVIDFSSIKELQDNKENIEGVDIIDITYTYELVDCPSASTVALGINFAYDNNGTAESFSISGDVLSNLVSASPVTVPSAESAKLGALLNDVIKNNGTLAYQMTGDVANTSSSNCTFKVKLNVSGKATAKTK
jgi:hypothetical protein